MDKFNRFLEPGEGLVYSATAVSRRYRIILVYFFIFGVFFTLYPMIHFGRQSFLIWLVLVIILVVFLARSLAAVYDSYLLTDQRIIFLRAVSKDYFKKTAFLPLSEITKISIRGERNLYLYSNHERYHLKIKDLVIFARKLKELTNLP